MSLFQQYKKISSGGCISIDDLTVFNYSKCKIIYRGLISDIWLWSPHSCLSTYGRWKKVGISKSYTPVRSKIIKNIFYVRVIYIYQIWEIYLRLFIVAGLYYIHIVCLLLCWIESRGYFGSSTSTYWSVSWVIWVRAMLRFYYWELGLRFM